MLTKNFYSYIRATMQWTTATFTVVDGTSDGKNLTQLSSSNCLPPFKAMTTFTSSAVARGVTFGTGTTAPTVNDYCLESPITSGLTVTTPSAVTYSMTDEYEEYSATFGVTASSTVTISEIGLKCNTYWYSATDQKVVLIDRTVLDEPIVINAGQAKQLTYTIRMNYPTA